MSSPSSSDSFWFKNGDDSYCGGIKNGTGSMENALRQRNEGNKHHSKHPSGSIKHQNKDAEIMRIPRSKNSRLKYIRPQLRESTNVMSCAGIAATGAQSSLKRYRMEESIRGSVHGDSSSIDSPARSNKKHCLKRYKMKESRRGSVQVDSSSSDYTTRSKRKHHLRRYRMEESMRGSVHGDSSIDSPARS